MASYIEIGKSVYDTSNPREQRRLVVFIIRAFFHNSGMKKLMAYFDSNPVLKSMIADNPFPLEQVTRAFFYNGSTFQERLNLVQQHYDFLLHKIQPDALFKINSIHDNSMTICIWEKDFENIGTLKAIMMTEPGQRKEGLSSVELNLFKDGKYHDHLYQIMYWIAKDKENKDSLYIGAMQGPNMANARDIIKQMTKACHGYRTKNLVIYIVQAMARALGIEKIYAVTNEGYYANNHMRSNRKLKTSFSDFWMEAGGSSTDDSRFDSLPLVETRKTMEEVPTRKRAVYRRRFQMLDEIDEQVTSNVKAMLKE